MLVTYLRSSSYSAFDMCPQSFYLKYVLNLSDTSNLKADMGNAVHKSLELLATKKLAEQQGEQTFSSAELNKTWDVASFSPANALHEGFTYYSETLPTIHDWHSPVKLTFGDESYETLPFTFCKESLDKVLNNWGKIGNPLTREVIYPEKFFDFEIDEPWAKRDGYTLAVKGTIDLVCESGIPRLAEMIDYKTGQRKDWATGKVKEWEDLNNDFQLRLYHYVLCKLLPDYDDIQVTIIWVNQGGPYTLEISKSSLDQTKEMMHKRFREIELCQKPKLIQDGPDRWKCRAFCHFGRNNWEGSKKTICEHIRGETIKLGLDKCTKKYEKASSYVGGGRQ